jgi:hypothetical protein
VDESEAPVVEAAAAAALAVCMRADRASTMFIVSSHQAQLKWWNHNRYGEYTEGLLQYGVCALCELDPSPYMFR